MQIGGTPTVPGGHVVERHMPLLYAVPCGQQLGGVPIGLSGGQVGGAVSGARHAPRVNAVPCGQQLGGVPTGRSVGHCCCGVATERHLPFLNSVPVGQQLGGVPTGRSAGQVCGGITTARHLPFLNSVPVAQQLGGVPTGLEAGHSSVCGAVILVPPVPVLHALPSKLVPGGQAQRPSLVSSMPPVQAGSRLT
jgi:hypothetical protein